MSRARTVLALASIACSGLVGCGTRVDYTPLRAVQMSQRSPAQVEVFLERPAAYSRRAAEARRREREP